MIKKYIDKLFGRRKTVTHKDARPVIYGPDKHAIRKESISRCARRTCEELQRAGYLAFVVGGAVRDLLLDRVPKDFDVATSATPEQVRAEFRNARVIGRRFKLVHVHFGREIIEVATFRANHPTGDAEDETQGSRHESGRILRDNIYGNQEQDAQRRDFTINALYYDASGERIRDYANGTQDIRLRQIRLERARSEFKGILVKKYHGAVLLRPPSVKVSYDPARLRGPADAPVKIVQFTDYECPFCVNAEPVMEQLRAKYGNKVAVAVRDFPLRPIHPMKPLLGGLRAASSC